VIIKCSPTDALSFFLQWTKMSVLAFTSSLLIKQNSTKYHGSVVRSARFHSLLSRQHYKINSYSRFSLPVMSGCLALRAWDYTLGTTQCEAPISEQVVIASKDETVVITESIVTQKKTIGQKIRKAFRLWRRFIKLLVTLAPVAALYPLQKLLGSSNTSCSEEQDAHDLMMGDGSKTVDGPLGWYLSMCLYCVECSGAAVVKLMQWAGSRPDLFGQDFCTVFSRLQDDTTPHSWRYTERVMRETYGDDWKDRIQLGKVIGRCRCRQFCVDSSVFDA
jgi:hypothetical protein